MNGRSPRLSKTFHVGTQHSNAYYLFFWQCAYEGDQLLDLVWLELLSERRHFPLALCDNFNEFLIRLFLHFVRSQIFGFQGLARGGSAAAIRRMTQNTIRFVNLIHIALGSKERRKCQRCDAKEHSHSCSMQRNSSHEFSSIRCTIWRKKYFTFGEPSAMYSMRWPRV